ncbi:MAG: DUF2807 domain-containing protein [Ekhidna sp.]|nr:DUF2807 domain-containing protein [Ekhidna sp.]
MKKVFLITILGILVTCVALAQSEETRSLSSFSEIAAEEGINVFIKSGNKEEARVVSKSHDLDKILTDVFGDRLKIHIDNGRKWKWKSNKSVNVDVYVTYKSISGLSASSAASINSEGVIKANSNFDVDVSSAGDINAKIVGIDELNIDVSSSGDARLDVEAKEIKASTSSSGGIIIKGTVEYQDIEASSAGDYDGYDLISKEAEASASSGASIKVNVTEKMKGRASSGGSVKYKGEPKDVDADSSSGGSVRKVINVGKE